MRTTVVILIFIGTAGAALRAEAQSSITTRPKFEVASAPNAFEVVSIKPNRSGDRITGRTTLDPGERFTASNISARQLVIAAFDVRGPEISGGPGWFGEEFYDIDARGTGSGRLTLAELRPLLQEILATRFQFRFHTESRDLPVYRLVIGRNGSKLRKTADEAREPSLLIAGNGVSLSTIAATNEPVERLAKTLQMQLQQRVVDSTGLTGDFDFSLNWAPNDGVEATAPSIFTAVQEQLGLKLEAEKAPVKIIIVDGVKKPSVN